MPGLKGQARVPNTTDTRIRRNSAQLASSFSAVGGALVLDPTGVIVLSINANGGLIQTAGLSLNLATASGLTLATNTLAVLANPTTPTITVAAAGLSVKLATNLGLTAVAGGLSVVVAAPVTVGASGITMAVSTNAVDGYLSAADHTTFAAKEPPITAGTTAQYWRGDKSWQTLNQAAVAGLTTADSPTFAAITATGLVQGHLIMRTVVSDPQDLTPANRPAGTVAEQVYYGGKMYFCTNAATPTWEKITSL